MSSISLLPEHRGEQPPAPVPRPSILIAEDDLIFRRVLEKSLEKLGYNVTAVEDGSKAWEIIEGENAPKLIILDWMMPGLDGVELSRRIRSQKPVPYSYVLLLTARDDKRDLVNALNAGADDYLIKPFDVNELQARLRVGSRILALQDELIHTQEELRFEARHDPLTALWNRGAILGFLRCELDRASRTNQPVGVLMIDLDHFKEINDSYGHLAGDMVLREVARRLTDSIRTYDWVGRYGGEEFLVIVSDCPVATLKNYAERLRAAVAEKPMSTGSSEVHLTASIGVATATAQLRPDHDSLLRAADSALYLAKERGRNRVEFA